MRHFKDKDHNASRWLTGGFSCCLPFGNSPLVILLSLLINLSFRNGHKFSGEFFEAFGFGFLFHRAMIPYSKKREGTRSSLEIPGMLNSVPSVFPLKCVHRDAARQRRNDLACRARFGLECETDKQDRAAMFPPLGLSAAQSCEDNGISAEGPRCGFNYGRSHYAATGYSKSTGISAEREHQSKGLNDLYYSGEDARRIRFGNCSVSPAW